MDGKPILEINAKSTKKILATAPHSLRINFASRSRALFRALLNSTFPLYCISRGEILRVPISNFPNTRCCSSVRRHNGVNALMHKKVHLQYLAAVSEKKRERERNIHDNVNTSCIHTRCSENIYVLTYSFPYADEKKTAIRQVFWPRWNFCVRLVYAVYALEI